MKRFIAVTLACCVVFGVVGCGNGTNETNTPTNTEQSEQKEEKRKKLIFPKCQMKKLSINLLKLDFQLVK